MIFWMSLINLDNENNYVYVKLYKEVTQNQLIRLIESLESQWRLCITQIIRLRRESQIRKI